MSSNVASKYFFITFFASDAATTKPQGWDVFSGFSSKCNHGQFPQKLRSLSLCVFANFNHFYVVFRVMASFSLAFQSVGPGLLSLWIMTVSIFTQDVQLLFWAQNMWYDV